MYTLYVPRDIQISMTDMDSVDALLKMPACIKYTPQKTADVPNINLSRSGMQATPTFNEISLTIDNVDMNEVADLTKKVVIWAKRCRIPGVRGDRLAIVRNPHINSAKREVTYDIFLGTVVFYNSRYATLGVSMTDDELMEDLANLKPYIAMTPTLRRGDENAENGYREVRSYDDEAEAAAHDVQSLTDSPFSPDQVMPVDVAVADPFDDDEDFIEPDFEDTEFVDPPDQLVEDIKAMFDENTSFDQASHLMDHLNSVRARLAADQSI